MVLMDNIHESTYNVEYWSYIDLYVVLKYHCSQLDISHMVTY